MGQKKKGTFVNTYATHLLMSIWLGINMWLGVKDPGFKSDFPLTYSMIQDKPPTPLFKSLPVKWYPLAQDTSGSDILRILELDSYENNIELEYLMFFGVTSREKLWTYLIFE